MNSLSWILYWADTLPSLATTVAIVTFLLAIPCAMSSLFYFTRGFGDCRDEEYINRFKNFPLYLVLCIGLGISTSLVPSRETFYLIAASEAGEEALSSPELVKVRKIINQWLDEALLKEKEDVE